MQEEGFEPSKALSQQISQIAFDLRNITRLFFRQFEVLLDGFFQGFCPKKGRTSKSLLSLSRLTASLLLHDEPPSELQLETVAKSKEG